MTPEIAPVGAPKTHLRTDIQALRGSAVLAVVFYHAGIPFLPAGYLGVDVFFVISGFLITKLIAKEMDHGSFNFGDFYFRRAKRLLPAAYVVVFATIIIAPFFISELAFEEMKAQVWGAITFTSNFVLMGQSGYFEGAAETKPFLHFWSLAIEEQYYLAMPLLITLTPRRMWVSLLAGVFCLSFAACIWLAQRDAGLAFYLTPTRAWELCLGSLVALAPVQAVPLRMRSFARIPALIALLVVPAFPSGLVHPSLDALLVTLATAIVISGANGSWIERSPPVRALAAVGDFSYSLYLVHWPVLVFTRAAWLEKAPMAALLLAVLISFALGYLLFLCVEEPFRRGLFTGKKNMVWGLLATSIGAAIAPVALAAATSGDRDFTQVRRVNYGLNRACAFGGRYEFNGELPAECRTQEDARILVLGDSYAMAWTSVLMGPLAEYGIEQATKSACDPVLGMARFPEKPHETYDREYAKSCIDIFDQILDYAQNREQLEIVAIGGRFSSILSSGNLMLVRTPNGFEEHPTSVPLAAHGLAELAKDLRAAGKNVVILAPPPADGSEIGDCLERQARGKITFGDAASCDILRSDVERTRAETWKFLRLAAEKANVPIFHMNDFLCDDSVCRTSIDETFIYRDSGHLSYEGAALIGTQSDIADQLMDFLR